MLKIENLSYRYPNRSENTLKNINLSITTGEFVLMAGKSGCGKSTLIKAITGIFETERRGCLSGKIFLDGRESQDLPPEEIALLAGTVYQTPDDQLFAMTVYDEVAFALENRGFPDEYIKTKVCETLEMVGLGDRVDYSIQALSGGQRQRLALASVLVTGPRLLVLDEPISQLNPQGAHDFLRLLQELNQKQNLTILLIEHRVNEIAGYFSRIIVMNEGSIAYDGDINKVWPAVSRLKNIGLREPQNIILCRLLKLPELVNDADTVAAMVTDVYGNLKIVNKYQSVVAATGQTILDIKNVYYKYDNALEDTLKNISFTLQKGKITALMGVNGTGKSTLMNLLGGIAAIDRGTICLDGRDLQNERFNVGYLRQEADLMLLADSVREELCWNNKKISEVELQIMLKKIGLENYAGDFPLALSKGQRLRVILSAVLMQKPKLLLLDEPTTGQDQQSLEEIKKLLCAYAEDGGSVFFCTHDVELASEIADSVILMNDGQIIADDITSKVLTDRNYLKLCGLKAPTMLDVTDLLHIRPLLTAKEVADYVLASAVGR